VLREGTKERRNEGTSDRVPNVGVLQTGEELLLCELADLLAVALPRKHKEHRVVGIDADIGSELLDAIDAELLARERNVYQRRQRWFERRIHSSTRASANGERINAPLYLSNHSVAAAMSKLDEALLALELPRDEGSGGESKYALTADSTFHLAAFKYLLATVSDLSKQVTGAGVRLCMCWYMACPTHASRMRRHARSRESDSESEGLPLRATRTARR